MRRFGWRWLAISLLLATAGAETRPQYGGTLQISTRTVLTSLDPADRSQPDSFVRRNILLLMFETLVRTDESGRLHPGLAAAWRTLPESPAGKKAWELQLRRDVHFHDGAPLSAEIAAAALRTANPSWNVSVAGDSIRIESDAEMPAELAVARNAIVKRNPDSTISGTGPFYANDWQPGKRLSLAAEEGYRQGRAFVDAVEIEMGKNFRDQWLALQVGKADLVEVAPEAGRGSAEGIASSAPMELVALVFSRAEENPDEKLSREALAASIERTSMRNVLLQGAGEAVGSVLPNWMTGYGFVFGWEADLTRARHLREQAKKVPAWSIGYDASDPPARTLAERVALNAKDAGLVLRPTTVATTDLRLVRIPLASPDPWVSLATIGEVCGLPRPTLNGRSVEDLFLAEREMLATGQIIPLFHLPVSYAGAPHLKHWSPRPDGVWDVSDAWLGSEKP